MNEAFSAVARREVRAARQVPFTVLHDLEVRNALRALCGRGQITGRELERLLGQVDDDLGARRLLATHPNLAQVFATAALMSHAHTRKLLCRSLDVLHVAAALELGCARLVSGDDRQLALAKAAGLRVVDIQVPR